MEQAKLRKQLMSVTMGATEPEGPAGSGGGDDDEEEGGQESNRGRGGRDDSARRCTLKIFSNCLDKFVYCRVALTLERMSGCEYLAAWQG